MSLWDQPEGGHASGIAVALDPETVKMLEALASMDNAEYYPLLCVRIVERVFVALEAIHDSRVSN